MKIGCCIDAKYYDYACQVGYEFVDLSGKAIAALNDNEFLDLKKKILTGPIPCLGINSYCPSEVIIAGPGFDEEKIYEYGRNTIKRVNSLGAKSIGIGCPASRTLPKDYDLEKAKSQLMKFLEITCEIANDFNMDVLMESLSTLETNFINTTSEALEIVEMLGLNNLKMVYDIYHVAMMKEDTLDFNKAFNYISHLHISDGYNGKRLYLNENNMDIYNPYLENIYRSNYKGNIAIEAFFGDHIEGLTQSYDVLKRYC